MRVEVNESGHIELKEVYNGVTLVSNDNEKFFICMRDSGFEFSLDGKQYEAKRRMVTPWEKNRRKSGQSTRIIDNAIQELFTNGTVDLIEHHESRTALKLTFDKLMSRLQKEHDIIDAHVVKHDKRISITLPRP